MSELTIVNDVFECKRCGYNTDQKCNLIRHLQKKIPCETTNYIVSRETLIQEATHKDYNETTFSCVYCLRKFNTNQSRYRHQHICKKTIKVKDNNKSLSPSEKIDSLRLEIEKLKIEIAQKDKLIGKLQQIK